MKLVKRILTPRLVPALALATLACHDAATTAPLRVESTTARVTASALTGRIVYTLSGKLRIYDVALRADVYIGVNGVNPKFSPDGSLIVFQDNGVKVVNSDGTNKRTLSAVGGTPSFDPTGTVVAFGNDGIWKINVDGTGLTRITSDGGRQPAWSPDGSQIAYAASAGSSQQLFIVRVDGTDRHQVLTTGAVLDPVWQPSTQILFAALAAKNNYELYSVDPSNVASLVRLTNLKGSDFEPSWSPDATAISWAGSSGISLMNADGTGIQSAVIARGRQGSWGR